jgi:hypothetical protein
MRGRPLRSACTRCRGALGRSGPGEGQYSSGRTRWLYTHLQSATRVAGAGPLAVAGGFGRPRRCVMAACTSAYSHRARRVWRTHRGRRRRPHAHTPRATPRAPSATSRARDPAQRPAGQAARDAGAAGGSMGGRRCAGARPCTPGAEAATRRRVGGQLGRPLPLLSRCIGGSVFERPARVCPAVEI